MSPKRSAVAALEALCGLLDKAPAFWVEDHRIRRGVGGYGCRLGLGSLSARLDERWAAGVWEAR